MARIDERITIYPAAHVKIIYPTVQDAYRKYPSFVAHTLANEVDKLKEVLKREYADRMFKDTGLTISDADWKEYIRENGIV